MNSFYLQWQTFLTLAGGGILMGFFFDLYRVCRYFWRPSYWITQITDFILWTVFLAITFALLMLTNYGEVRGYVFVALSLGWGVYATVAGQATRRSLYRVGRVLLYVWGFWDGPQKNRPVPKG